MRLVEGLLHRLAAPREPLAAPHSPAQSGGWPATNTKRPGQLPGALVISGAVIRDGG